MTERPFLVSIDPGITTGIATCNPAGDFATCTLGSSGEVWDFVLQHEGVKDALVLAEQFVTKGRISKYGLETVRIIGGIQALCRQFDIRLQMDMPGHRIAYIPDALRLLPRSTEHEMDALSHILAWEAEHGYRREIPARAGTKQREQRAVRATNNTRPLGRSSQSTPSAPTTTVKKHGRTVTFTKYTPSPHNKRKNT